MNIRDMLAAQGKDLAALEKKPAKGKKFCTHCEMSDDGKHAVGCVTNIQVVPTSKPSIIVAEVVRDVVPAKATTIVLDDGHRRPTYEEYLAKLRVGMTFELSEAQKLLVPGDGGWAVRPASGAKISGGTSDFTAHNKWKNTPADQWYPSVAVMDDVVSKVEGECERQVITLNDIRATAIDGELVLDVAGKQWQFTNHGASQFGSHLGGVPMTYLGSVPADSAARLVNWHISKLPAGTTGNALIHEPTGSVLGIQGERYAQLDSGLLVKKAGVLVENGWINPPARSPKPELGSGWISAGLYWSPKSLFLFLVDVDHPVMFQGNPYYRAMFIENSTVGTRAVHLTAFLVAAVCGNHICWNVPWMKKYSRRHTGDVVSVSERTFVDFGRGLTEASTSQDVALMAKMAQMQIASTDDQAVEFLTAKAKSLTQENAKQAVVLANQYDGGARTLWQMVQGVTRQAQYQPTMEGRIEMEKNVAGKLVALALN